MDFKTGDDVVIGNTEVFHLKEYIGKNGIIISYIIKTKDSPKKYKVLFSDGATAYFLAVEMTKL